ncbi:hypothetical protein RDI58_000963 [Solanum bulbocastanum]|uniref:Uncharacterized protein n=1 Tax=Solanum bulbocastanum TaxID=147425 RepID=A0AAN8U458_SOLBU
MEQAVKRSTIDRILDAASHKRYKEIRYMGFFSREGF